MQQSPLDFTAWSINDLESYIVHHGGTCDDCTLSEEFVKRAVELTPSVSDVRTEIELHETFDEDEDEAYDDLLEPRSELPPNAPRGAQTFGSTSSSEVFEHVALRPELNRRLSTMNLTAGTPPPTSPLNLKLPDLSNAVQYFSKQPPSKDAYQALGSILLQQAEAALDIPKVVELRQHIGTQISNLD